MVRDSSTAVFFQENFFPFSILYHPAAKVIDRKPMARRPSRLSMHRRGGGGGLPPPFERSKACGTCRLNMSSTPRSKSKPAWYHIDKGALTVSNALDNVVEKILANDLARNSAVGIKAFSFNSKAKYQPGPQHAASHHVGELRKGRVQVQAGDPQKFFEAKYPDIFEKYPLRVYSEDLVLAWRTNPMRFWQNQLNFAVWCATSGCGISVEDHLTNDNEFLRSVYRFHAYY